MIFTTFRNSWGQAVKRLKVLDQNSTSMKDINLFCNNIYPQLQDRCEEIKWHYIGRLQRNKVAKLLGMLI